MTFYSVLDVTPRNVDWVEDYLPMANQLVAKHGGKCLARTSSHEQIEGEQQDATLRIVFEWPSKAAAVAFENDPEYLPHLKARLDNTTSHHYLIEGKDDFSE